MALRLFCREFPKIQGVLIGRNLIKNSILPANQRLLSTVIAKKGICATTVAFNSGIYNRDVLVNKRLISVSAVRLSANGDHTKIWTAEKALSAALLGIIPLALYMPNIILDDLLVLSVVLHTHWGLEGIVIDYIRPVIFGSFIPKIMLFLVYLMSALTLGGLLNFNHNNMGVSNALKRFWSAERYIEEEDEPPTPTE